jgi:hypothetical protein
VAISECRLKASAAQIFGSKKGEYLTDCMGVRGFKFDVTNRSCDPIIEPEMDFCYQ